MGHVLELSRQPRVRVLRPVVRLAVGSHELHIVEVRVDASVLLALRLLSHLLEANRLLNSQMVVRRVCLPDRVPENVILVSCNCHLDYLLDYTVQHAFSTLLGATARLKFHLVCLLILLLLLQCFKESFVAISDSIHITRLVTSSTRSSRGTASL